VALESVEELASSEVITRPYAPDELVAVLRSTVGHAGPDIEFSYAIDDTQVVPREVVAALAEATEEAIRNSLLHAGEGATRNVSVGVAPAGVNVTVEDTGRGFAPRDVPQRRLGLRVSIIERMRNLPGGDASVRSRPGMGTTIRLTWARA
jgi:signal transduction histidine kinase